MTRIICCAVLTALLGGCITAHFGGGQTAYLYTWDDQENPITTRVASDDDTTFRGLYFETLQFGDVLEEHPDLDTHSATPYVLKLCDKTICYYSILFPGYYRLSNNGSVLGLGTINALTTAFYHQVKDRPMGEVQFWLDSWALQVVNGEVPGQGDGGVNYRDIATLDYYDSVANLELLIDPGMPDRAAAILDACGVVLLEDLLSEETTAVDCGGGGDGDGDGDGSSEEGGPLTSWLINDSGAQSQHIVEFGVGVPVNVQSVETVNSFGKDFARVSASGIPDYVVTVTQDLLDWLNGRPQANSDFGTGSATVTVGQQVQFGADIGYNSNSDCSPGEGYGYWPPGPVCPSNQSHIVDIPLAPIPTSIECDTGAGSVGYYVNGTSVFNWTDAQTYNNEGVWQTLAPVAEVYDVDICGGHAANGEYHHHFYSDCLRELIGDTGNGHSPIYGFAADGYPIYGPWESNGELARSSWRVRDYDDPGSATGCGVAGARTCLLIDQYDPGQGTMSTSQSGPTTSGSFTSLSRNVFDTPSGFFFEDWYWDASLSAQGGAWLDQYNGHSDEVRGYHYHLTIEFIDGEAVPTFPYSVGPRFAGELQENAAASCSTGIGGPGGGGGGPGPGGGMMPPPRG